MTAGPEQGETADVPAARSASGDDEVARLRDQVAKLQTELAETRTDPADSPGGPAATGRTGWWRTLVVSICLTLAAILAALSVVAMWAHDQVGNTDRYLQTVGPLASDPAVQNAVIARVSTEIFDRLDVEAVTKEAVDALQQQGLPPRVATSLNALSTPLANGVRSFITQQVARIVRSPQFADAWVEANRTAHTQMVALLTGKDTDTVTITNNSVSVNLATVINAVKQKLIDSGFALAQRIPAVDAQFTIVESADLAKAQNGFKLLSALARWLPIIALVLIAVAVYVAKSRRRALLAAGLAVAGGMLLLGATLNVLRPAYLSAVPSDQLPQDAAAAVYDQVVGFIRLSLRAVAVVALAVAAGAWLAGPSSSATATKHAFATGVQAVRSGGEHVGVDTGAFGAFLFRYRTLLRGVVIGGALLLYVAADHPTGAWTLKLLLVAVVVLVVLELLARPPRETETAEVPAPPPGAPA